MNVRPSLWIWDGNHLVTSLQLFPFLTPPPAHHLFMLALLEVVSQDFPPGVPCVLQLLSCAGESLGLMSPECGHNLGVGWGVLPISWLPLVPTCSTLGSMCLFRPLVTKAEVREPRWLSASPLPLLWKQMMTMLSPDGSGESCSCTAGILVSNARVSVICSR
jgi:hypothetical protein